MQSRCLTGGLARLKPNLRTIQCQPRAAMGTCVNVGHSDRAEAVLSYWIGPGCAAPNATFPQDKLSSLWFASNSTIDEDIRHRFQDDVKNIRQGVYDDWLQLAHTTIAGIILMDQFTRNIYRGTPDAFSLDSKAVSWSQHLVDSQQLLSLPPALRMFAYYPYMHAEDVALQEIGVGLWAADVERTSTGTDPSVPKVMATCLDYAERHRNVVAKYGRFPHRNVILGRKSTTEEEAGLADGSIQKFG